MAASTPTAKSANRRLVLSIRYSLALFAVCGIFALTLGEGDPLLNSAQRLKTESERLFKINKDPATASQAELDGPAEATFALESPRLAELVSKLTRFRDVLSKESFGRATRFEVGDPALIAVAESVKIYHEIQFGLYRNYLRLAHDKPYLAYEDPGFWGTIKRGVLGVFKGTAWVGPAGPVPYDPVAEEAAWEKKNAVALKTNGARDFKPEFYDGLNVRISPVVAHELYGNDESGKDKYGLSFSIRHVAGADGGYGTVEVFLNSFEKQLAEYLAIQDPKDKLEYAKLMQFAAVRQGMANRWAIRRLLGNFTDAGLGRLRDYAAGRRNGNWFERHFVDMKPPMVPASIPDGAKENLGYADLRLNACASDLVSFRAPAGATVDENPAYDAYWQEDRYEDLHLTAARAAAETSYRRPLLSPEGYADIYLRFVSEFPEFTTKVFPKYGGDLEAVRKHMLNDAFGDGLGSRSAIVAQGEEMNWSSDLSEGKVAGGSTVALETFAHASYPADDLSFGAVAARFADRAFESRAQKLASALTATATLDAEAIDPSGAAVGKDEYVEEVNPYSGEVTRVPANRVPATSANDAPRLPTYSGTTSDAAIKRARDLAQEVLAPIEKSWKRSLAKDVERVLYAKLGTPAMTRSGKLIGVGYRRTRNGQRFEAYFSDLMKTAAGGIVGIEIRKAAEKSAELLGKARDRATVEVKSQVGSRGMQTVKSKRIVYPDPSSIKDKGQPAYYSGFVPWRSPAQRWGLAKLVTPDTSDRISQYFRKKLELVLSFDDRLVHAEEVKIAREISDNEIVMRGMDLLFGKIAEKAAEAGGGGTIGDCENTLPGAGGRAPANAESDCGMPTSDEGARKRAALESAIIPAAKEAFVEFGKKLLERGVYKDPERAKRYEADLAALNRSRALDADATKALEAKKKSMSPKDRAEFEAAERRQASATAVERARARLTLGYFRNGRNSALDKTGGELYVADPAKRERAKQLYVEALAMIGIAADVTGKAPPKFLESRSGNGEPSALPARVVSWRQVEDILRRRVPNPSILERMMASITDQRALGQVLEGEALGKAPILSIQATWNFRNGDEEAPILLNKLARRWSWKTGWDERGARADFREALAITAVNDVGKVETFCAADLKNYKSDPNFRHLFQSVASVRSMFAKEENPRLKQWDSEIEKEVKPLHEKFNDWMNENLGGWKFMVALILVSVLVTLPGVNAVILGWQASTAVWLSFAGKFAAAVVWLLQSNYGLQLIFSLQTVALTDIYFFKHPAQLGFSFQVANSQIHSMEGDGRPVHGLIAQKLVSRTGLIDHEHVRMLKEQLYGDQAFSGGISIVAEILQFRFLTYPEIRRSLGLTGQKFYRRLASASDKAVLESVRTKSLPELMRQHQGEPDGWKKAISEYWNGDGTTPGAKWALATFARKSVIRGGENANRALHAALGEKLSTIITDKAVLRQVYEAAKAKNVKAIVELFGTTDLPMIYSRDLAKALPGLEERLGETLKGLKPNAKIGETAEISVLFDHLAKDREAAIQAAIRSLSTNATEAVQEATARAAQAWSKAVGVEKWVAIENLYRENVEIERALAELERGVPAEGGTATRAFLGTQEPAAQASLRKYLAESKREILGQSRWRAVNRAFKDQDYLIEDWRRNDRWSYPRWQQSLKMNDPAALEKWAFYSRGLPQVYYDVSGTAYFPSDFHKDEKTGKWTAYVKTPETDPKRPSAQAFSVEYAIGDGPENDASRYFSGVVTVKKGADGRWKIYDLDKEIRGVADPKLREILRAWKNAYDGGVRALLPGAAEAAVPADRLARLQRLLRDLPDLESRFPRIEDRALADQVGAWRDELLRLVGDDLDRLRVNAETVNEAKIDELRQKIKYAMQNVK